MELVQVNTITMKNESFGGLLVEMRKKYSHHLGSAVSQILGDNDHSLGQVRNGNLP